MAQAKIALNTAQDFENHFNVSRETMRRILTYEALLRKWQMRVNLVGPATLDDFWSRHVADSAQIWGLLARKPRIWLDLGSGAGFPALIIAFLMAETRTGTRAETGHMYLIERNRKKCAFLRAVIRETGVAATLYEDTIEAVQANLPPELVEIDVISARALAPLPKLLDLAAGFCNPSTIALFHKGRGWREEWALAAQYWKLDVQFHQSVTAGDAKILLIKGLCQ